MSFFTELYVTVSSGSKGMIFGKANFWGAGRRLTVTEVMSSHLEERSSQTLGQQLAEPGYTAC